MSIDESILNLLEALGCGGLLLDKKGRVLQTNEKARRYLGSQFNIKRRGGVPEGTTNDKVQAALLLTPAEARLAKRLSCGEDLGSIAKGLDVARGTLRAQLKALFWKTGTRRQGELIALLAHLSRLQSE